MTNKITAIIPTYKRPYLLKNAIQSVLDQTFSDFVLIVLDNHSEDETGDIVKEYQRKDPRIQYICHAENIGMMKNYEYGFSLIQTPYFHFLSDDDSILPSFYEDAIEIFSRHKDIGFYSGSTQIVSSAHTIIAEPNLQWAKEGYWQKTAATIEMIGKFPVPTAVLFSRDIVTKVSPDFSNSLYWDCDFLMQISIRYPLYISKKQAGIFTSHDNSFSRYPHIALVFHAFDKMIARVHDVDELSEATRHLLKKKIKEYFRKNVFRVHLLHMLEKGDSDSVWTNLRALRRSYCVSTAFSPVIILSLCTRVYPCTIPVLRKGKGILQLLTKKLLGRWCS